MEVRAAARFIRVPPRKARAVGALVKGKHVHDALAILKFTPNASARIVEKLVKSAIANAENNNHLDGDALKVQQVIVDQGPSLKRIQPRAMGRAYRILKRTSHIAVVVTEAEARVSRKRKAEPKRGFLRRRRAEAEAPEAAAPGHRRGKRAAEPKKKEIAPAVEEAPAAQPEVIEEPAAAEPEAAEAQAAEESPAPTEGEAEDKAEGKSEGGD